MNTDSKPILKINKVRLHHLQMMWQAFWQTQPLPQLDRWLAQRFRDNKSYGKKDRAFFSESMFALTRLGYLLLYVDRFHNAENSSDEFKEVVADDTSQTNQQLKMRMFYSIFDEPAKVTKALAAVDLENHIHILGGQLQDELARYLKDLHGESLAALMLSHGLPSYFERHLKRRVETSRWSAKQLQTFLQMQTYRPPLWLRINSEQQRYKVLCELQQGGYRLVEENLNNPELADKNLAVAVEGNKSLYDLASFNNGFFEIQDFASQQIGLACAVMPGQSVWDVCAGGGGKTVQLAAALQNKGLICASEVRAYKLDEIKRRLKRGSYFNVQTYAWDGVKIPVFSGRNDLMFDCVLVDAPCSGSGTWRRNPDGKFRPLLAELAALAELQYKILRLSSQRVKKGGRLVYATCSFLVEENEDIVMRFLADCPQFERQSQALHGAPDSNADTTFTAVLIHK